MKRLTCIQFYDADGIVRRNVLYYLRALREISDVLYVVVSGDIDEIGYKQVSLIADQVIIKENVGFDIGAHCMVLKDVVSFPKLRIYDELLLTNCTCYGPIYPLSEVFDTMEKRKCDFWGLVKHPEQSNFLLPNNKGYIYEHIMSYFTVIRKRMLCSPEFENYWREMPAFTKKEEVVGLHETQFTKHFENLGFISDAYVDLSHYQGRCNNSSIILANELLINDRCPMVKKRAFVFPPYDNLIDISDTHQTVELLRFIREKTDYDESMIWENILQTAKLSLFQQTMHLTKVLTGDTKESLKAKQLLLGALIYIPCLELMPLYEPHIQTLLDMHCRIRLFYSDEDVGTIVPDLGEYGAAIKLEEQGEATILECLLRGRELLETCDYCCCLLHTVIDKPSLWVTEEDAVSRMLHAVVKDEKHIEEILELFSEQPCLGMVNSMPVSFGPFYTKTAAYMSSRTRINALRALHEQTMQLSIPFDDNGLDLADLAFWIRGNATQEILCQISKKEVYTELAEIRYASRYFLPRLVQASGYYPLRVILAQDASTMLDNQRYDSMRLYQTMQKMRIGNAWSRRTLQNSLMSLMNAQANRRQILQQPFKAREIVKIILRYPHHKLNHILGRDIKAARAVHSANNTAVGSILIGTITLDGNRLLFYVLSSNLAFDFVHIQAGYKKYYRLRYLTKTQQDLVDYGNTTKHKAAFFEVPIDVALQQPLLFQNEKNEHYKVNWLGGVMSFNGLELKEKNIYIRLSMNTLYIDRKKRFLRTVYRSKDYSMRDKLLFCFAHLNPFHPITLMAENNGAADNSFQLFQYAVKQGEKAYYVCSQAIKDSQTDANLQKHMLVYNSKQHILAMLFTKRWITSFSLRVECLPTKNVLKDIHYELLPTEWVFLPHGLLLPDKIPYMCFCYHWENPSKTFVSSAMEQDCFANVCKFKNVGYLGAPRMDKWVDVKPNDNEILVFFTWRLSLSNRMFHNVKPDDLRKARYFEAISECIRQISSAQPEKIIYYVFHHEVVKQHYDQIIKELLKDYQIEYIYLNTNEGIKDFNQHFRNSRYLITDVSSVAYDFAYKEGGIPIYYQPQGFTDGHYVIDDALFKKINLGVIVKTNEELMQALSMKQKTLEMEKRLKAFFPYLDGNNCRRVYEAVFKKKECDNIISGNDTRLSMPKKPKRLGIYFFFDQDGIVDRYVLYYLRELRMHCKELCVVVNGNLKTEGQKQISAVCDKLILRENIGFDSSAYKEAIESYGYERIACDYDELILNNFTNFGPIYPFGEMLDEMTNRECDFWGHCAHLGEDAHRIKSYQVVVHLMSYFIVFKKNILLSPAFSEYWQSLQVALDYSDAVGVHELRCTNFFEQRGFAWDSYISSEKYGKFGNSPVWCAYSQLTQDRNPLLKRKVFFVKNGAFEFAMHGKDTPYDILRYIRQHTSYDPMLIVENIERTNGLRSQPAPNPTVAANANFNYTSFIKAAKG